MNLKPASALILAALFSTLLSGQSETYLVKKAYFSTDKYDEFSPVVFSHGIVFCTNRPVTRLKSYSTDSNKGFIKIYYIDTTNRSLPPRILAKELSTNLNDGPVTFDRNDDTIFYSRNIITEGKTSEISSVRNKLGIFYSVYDGQEWSKIREMRINNEWYNVTTPWLTPDGKRLYFASDKPGGYGGSDLYYSQWKNEFWSDPVNLGPVINTKGNESYPFINAADEFFFASDGHPGLGGKDIFFSMHSDTAWAEPICLDAPINSQYDDFGIYTDTLMEKGYFSSNRDKSLDIFQFRTNFSQTFYKIEQKENNYCFIFSDSGAVAVDTMNLKYVWNFGDGKTATGAVVTHCYTAPGKYPVKLDITERASGRIYFSKLSAELTIHDNVQAYISAPEYGIKGEELAVDGLRSNLPGYKILNYSWDFGDRNRAKGEKASHSYKNSGEYILNLELGLRSDSTGLMKKTGVSRKIVIFSSKQEKDDFLARQPKTKQSAPDVRHSNNADLSVLYSAESVFGNDAVYRIELLTSKSKIDLAGPQFKNVPSIYTVKERYTPADGVYSYTVDQHMNLMFAYPAYMKMAALGFKDARVKMAVLTDPAEKELHNLLRVNGISTDAYFDYSDRLTSNAFIMLDQVVKMMNKFPTLKLEIAIHTDNSGSADNNQAVSQKRAQAMAEYLTNRGINVRRIVPMGYGGSKPIASNIYEKDRKVNRRVDFTILSR